MREIKFRAWDIKAKAFIVPFDFMIDGMGTVLEKEANTIVSAYFPTTRKIIVQQFTGLRDKNGKEIYEGDVLRSYIYNKEAPFVCEFVDGGFRFRFNTTMHEHPDKYMEVIGNVYETPELIK